MDSCRAKISGNPPENEIRNKWKWDSPIIVDSNAIITIAVDTNDVLSIVLVVFCWHHISQCVCCLRVMTACHCVTFRGNYIMLGVAYFWLAVICDNYLCVCASVASSRSPHTLPRFGIHVYFFSFTSNSIERQQRKMKLSAGTYFARNKKICFHMECIESCFIVGWFCMQFIRFFNLP